jgi:hypothetical protein
VPDSERRIVRPLQVIHHQHRRGSGAQLVRQRQQHLNADRHVAVGVRVEQPAAQQVGGVRPPRIR